MTGIFDDTTIDIECPNCKGKLKMAVRDLKRPDAKCKKCGIKFESSQFKRELDKAEQAVKDLKKTIDGMKF